MASRPHDVVVVGARAAGAATALLLARAGLDVLVLDRGRYGSDTLSTHALLRGGVLQLARWGVLPAVVAARTPAVRTTTFHHLDEPPTVVGIRPGRGVDALYAPRRQLLDRLLVDAAMQAGAHVRHAHTVSGLVQGDDGRVAGVRVTTGLGHDRTVRARWVVGADGVFSTVAREVAAPVERAGTGAGALLYRYVEDVDDSGVRGYEWAYGSAAAAGVIPTNDGLSCVFVSTTPDRMRAAARAGRDAAFTSLLAQASPQLAERLGAARA